VSCSASRGHVLIARPARTCIHYTYIQCTVHTRVEYIPIPNVPPSDLKTGDRLRSKRGTVAGVQGEGEDTAAAPYYKADYLDGLDVFVQPSAIHTHVGTRTPWTPACVCVCVCVCVPKTRKSWGHRREQMTGRNGGRSDG